MKRAFAGALVVLTLVFSSEARAEGQFIGLIYDYDLVNSNTAKIQSVQKRGLLVGQTTSLGTFDFTLYENARNGKVDDTYLGTEVAYSNKINLGKLRLRGRFSLGHIENGNTILGEHHGNYEQLITEAAYPITSSLVGVVAVRHRFSGDLPTSDKYVFGIQYMINPKTQLRLGYTTTRTNHLIYNGFSTGVFYEF